MKELKQITVIGLGLLGGSVSLAVKRSFPSIKTVGFTHRPSTRQKAKHLAVAEKIVDDIALSVADADIVIVAAPICTFEDIFSRIADALPKGCIVTDVGSTKVIPSRWAQKKLPAHVHYVGSHPIAGSEQRGVEFARDDFFEHALCILTTTKKTNPAALKTLKNFWSKLGCNIKLMTPVQHDKTFAKVSHLPHLLAASLINANTNKELEFAGKGFIDTSRIASGPANIWADIFITNSANTIKGIDKVLAELEKFKRAIKRGDKKQIEKLLTQAKNKRSEMINYKIKNKELIL